MNQVARRQKHPMEPSLARCLAALDDQDENQRRLRDLIHRLHKGRWPLFRCLGVRQIDGVIHEAVEWLRMAGERYSVVRWHPDGLGLSWEDAASAREALLSLRAI